MSAEELAAIAARRAAMLAGNKGQWRAQFSASELIIWFHADFNRDPTKIVLSDDEEPSANEKACAEFIINAPADITALLAEVQRLKKIEQAALELVSGLDNMSLKGFPHFERNELKKALADA